MKRRTFLLGTISGLSVAALSGCVPEKPVPTPTPSVPPTRPTAVPRPAAFARTTWSSDPFARGAFSFQAVGSTPEQRMALAQPVDNRIFFAGEHTDDVNPGTVQGAIASGRRVAAEVQAASQTGERVAVVGAGIAGATAARQLVDSGFTVVVIEGRERVGGRLHTMENDNWPIPLNLGAAWVLDSTQNTVAAELAAIDIDAEPFPFRYEERTSAGAVVEPSSVGPDAVTAALAWAAPQPADTSLANALTESGAGELSTDADEAGVSDAGRLATYLAGTVATDSAADADVLSSWYAGDPTRSPEDDRFVAGGYRELVRSKLDGIDMLSNSAVSTVTSTDRGVNLRLARGESLTIDRAVITVPLGVLQTNAIEFSPPLPFAHRGAISALGMGSLEKVVLRFDRPFWSTDATVWTIAADADALSLTPEGATPTPTPDATKAPAPVRWYNLQPLLDEPILMGVIGGAEAGRMAEFDDDDVLAAALASLEPFLDPEVLAAPQPTPTPTSPTPSP